MALVDELSNFRSVRLESGEARVDAEQIEGEFRAATTLRWTVYEALLSDQLTVQNSPTFGVVALTNLGDRLARLVRQRRARGGIPEELFQGHARASRLGLQMPPPRRDENGANLLR